MKNVSCIRHYKYVAILMLILFPISAYAQTSYYGVPSGKMGFGLGVISIGSEHRYYDGDNYYDLMTTEGLVGYFSFGFNNGNSKISVLGGPSRGATKGYSARTSRFNDPNETHYYSNYFTKFFYVGGIEAYHLYPLEAAGFEIYTRVDFLAWFHREAERAFFYIGPDGEDVVVPVDDMDIPTIFRGAIGLSKDFNIGNVGLRPSLGLGYCRHDVLVLPYRTDVVNSIQVEAGLELKIYFFTIQLSLTLGEKRNGSNSGQATLSMGYIPR